MLTLAALPGAEAALDYETFKTRIQPIFLHKRKGNARCIACHVGRTGFALANFSPGSKTWNEEQTRHNFQVASRFVVPGDPTASRLLMHPLSEKAGGDPYHSGGQHWYSQNDPEWQTLAAWVRAGGSESSDAAKSLDFEFYRTRVEPIFLNPRKGGGAALGGVGCFACHTILATPLRLQPLNAGSRTWTEEQSRRNFEAAARLVVPGEPLRSRLLLQPLATDAGGAPSHTGGKFWSSQNDPEFLILSEWVRRRP
jgi:mono/diheme cytochrome c family protein